MDIGDIIVGLVTALSTGGVFTAIFNRKQRKILDKVEADNKVSDQWQEIYQSEKQNRIEVQKRVNYLYNENTRLRNALDKANTKNAALLLTRCSKINCIEREPPFGGNIDLNSEGDIVFREYKYTEEEQKEVPPSEGYYTTG